MVGVNQNKVGVSLSEDGLRLIPLRFLYFTWSDDDRSVNEFG